MILDSKWLLQSLRHKVTSFCTKSMCQQLASHWGGAGKHYYGTVPYWSYLCNTQNTHLCGLQGNTHTHSTGEPNEIRDEATPPTLAELRGRPPPCRCCRRRAPSSWPSRSRCSLAQWPDGRPVRRPGSVRTVLQLPKNQK